MQPLVIIPDNEFHGTIWCVCLQSACGFTYYVAGSRGGHPLTAVPDSEASNKQGEEIEEMVETHDICDITGHGGSCGVWTKRKG